MTWWRWTLLALVLLGAAPLLSAIGSSIVADALGCDVNEAFSTPCPTAVGDVGPALTRAFVMGWLFLLSWPVAIGALMTWIVVEIVRGVRRAR